LYERGTEDTLLGKRTPLQWAQIVHDAAPNKLVFKTSGSSGEPKAIEHELSMLEDEARFWASVMPTEAARIVAICPAHHIYGFIWTELLSQAFESLHQRRLTVVDVALEDLSL
jgi:long-subunit acyl-CoA synthetase (AMP-forming)